MPGVLQANEFEPEGVFILQYKVASVIDCQEGSRFMNCKVLGVGHVGLPRILPGSESSDSSSFF